MDQPCGLLNYLCLNSRFFPDILREDCFTCRTVICFSPFLMDPAKSFCNGGAGEENLNCFKVLKVEEQQNYTDTPGTKRRPYLFNIFLYVHFDCVEMHFLISLLLWLYIT